MNTTKTEINIEWSNDKVDWLKGGKVFKSEEYAVRYINSLAEGTHTTYFRIVETKTAIRTKVIKELSKEGSEQ